MSASVHRASRRTLLAAALLAPGLAAATNGYFSHGNSIKSNGIAGIGVALPQDALAAAANPAGTALVGDRLDVGLTWFAPRRSADIQGNAYGADGHYAGNGRNSFFLPEFGYSHRLGERLAWGVALYGNGGMNTDYAQNPYAAFGASGAAGVNLEQLFVTPSLAIRLNERHALGIGANLLYQRFEAKGIGLFDNFSQSPGSVSDRGADTSTGVGLRLGWIGQLSPSLSAGLAWSSKIEASEFDRYRGLFAGGGSFDVPASYAAGLSWRAGPALTLAAEVQRIDYGGVRAIANPLASLLQGVPLGADDGAGFGWRDVTVYKLGGAYALSERLTIRAGASHASQPVPSSQTFFNILAPGVVQTHLTLGATWTTPGGNEISAYYTHAPARRVSGSGSIPAAFGGGEAGIELSENLLGIGFAWIF
ncbi:MAG: outer membrane protein transport protein [Pseudomonas sp.]